MEKLTVLQTVSRRSTNPCARSAGCRPAKASLPGPKKCTSTESRGSAGSTNARKASAPCRFGHQLIFARYPRRSGRATGGRGPR